MFTLILLLVGLAAFSDGQAISGRIVGGRDGAIEEVPYVVSMLVDGSHNCGGSIISSYWIVSAAHCFHREISRYSVRAGSAITNSGGIIHAVELYINHPLYGTLARHYHDINLVKVVEPFVFSAQVQPISLPAQSATVAAGTMSTVSGWGLVGWPLGGFPTVLQIAEIPIISWEQCQSFYGSSQHTDDMLCAGYPEGGIDACTSDSGGPLAVDELLYGVVSWGNGCALRGVPGVYADVAYFRDWIKENSGI